MNKNDLTIAEKIKADLTISSINITHKIKVTLEFTNHFFIIKFQSSFPKQTKIHELVNHILHPILKDEKENCFYINYALIKNASIFDVTNLKMQIYNPITSSNFTLNFRSIESVGVLFNKRLSFESINQISKKITNLINLEIKYLIEQFLYLFTLLRDCLDPKKSENPSVEEILLKAYLNGKTYYEKYINELKKNSKLKQTVSKDLSDKIDTIITTQSEISKLGASRNNVKRATYFSQNELTMESFASFDSLLNEFKIRTSIYIEESIVLFFKIVSVDHSSINMSFKDMDKKSISHNLKSVNERERKPKYKKFPLMQDPTSYANRSVIEKKPNSYSINELSENSESTKTGSKQNKNKKNRSFVSENNNNNELLETPKFYDKNRRKNYNSDTISNGSMSISEVVKHIDEGKKLHSFVPPTNTQNIFFNTAEIIHRKFFEFIFEEFLGKIFTYEKDNDNLIKLDSLYNYFVYLRGMKNILFIEKNRIYFSSVFFMDDDEIPQ